MADGTIMIIGLGAVGGKALEILARRTGIARIVGADVNEEYGSQKVNNASFGAQLEGIEQIKEDGTVLFTDKSCRIMKELLNYECKEMRIHECEQRAVELSRFYNESAMKYVK